MWYLNRLPGPAAAQTADASEETEQDDEDERREDVDVRRLQTALPCLDLVMRIHDNLLITLVIIYDIIMRATTTNQQDTI